MDPFEDVANLEQQYYTEGYALGLSDGQEAGRVEGRQFGMQKAHEKFFELGELNGWSTLLVSNTIQKVSTTASQPQSRLQKHLTKLQELTDIENMPTENSEAGVADIDERTREAKAKALLITKMTDKDKTMTSNSVASTRPTKASSELEDFVGIGRLRNGSRAS